MNVQELPLMQRTAYPGRAYAYYVVVILMLVTFASLLDRNLLQLLVQPIRKSLAVGDTGIGILQGLAFVVFYTVMGVPFGRLVDRTHRRNLILAGLLLWSGATILSGLAHSYWQLFLGRVGVGIGEAVLAPAAYSLIADYFAPEQRGRALAIYYGSLTVGSGASLLLSGAILKSFPHAVHLSLFGIVQPWQMVFIVAGLPGLLLAPLLFSVREVVRRSQTGLESATSREDRSLSRFFAHMGENLSAFAAVYANYACVAFACLPVQFWVAAFYARKFGLGLPLIGLFNGLTLILGGFAGSMLSGMVSDRFVKRNARGTRLLVSVVGWLVLVPLFALWPFLHNLALSMAIFVVLTLFNTFLSSSAPSTVQDLVPNHMRGQAIAIYLLIAGLIGMGLGTALVGALNDHLFHSDQALPYSLVLVSVPGAAIGLIVSWFGLKPYDRTRLKLIGA